MPLRLLDRETVRRAQATLRYQEIKMDRVSALKAGMDYDESNEEGNSNDLNVPSIVNEYVRRPGGVSLPRSWAMKNLQLDWQDITVFPKLKIAGTGPTPRDDRQKEFFSQLLREARMPGPQDILANANTGAGKSVAGIWLGHQLQTRTLIIVDSNKIANGWLKNFEKFYGKEWTEKNVGRIQQDQCEWEDRKFSIGLVQSIAARAGRYPLSMYNGFGLIAFDEVQIFGSVQYAKVLGMFSARVRVGFTAENRSGSFGRLIKAHLGKPRVISHQQVLTPQAFLIKNEIEGGFYDKSDGAILSGLARLSDRNDKLAKLIVRRGYNRDRNVLVLSDRTAHLVELRNRCVRLGVPTEAMGLHMGSYISGRTEVVYSYGKSKFSLAVFEDMREAHACMTALKKGKYNIELPKALAERLRKDAQSVIFTLRKQEYVPSQIELDNITNSCQIIFATYQIFSKGVDVPRLDMGVEALPSGNLKQPLGRILRIYDGKPQPEWYAVCDTALHGIFLQGFLEGKTEARVSALKKAKAKLIYA